MFCIFKSLIGTSMTYHFSVYVPLRIYFIDISTLSNSEQINHPFSNHTYTKSTPNHIHHHYVPFVTLTYTTHIISSSTPTYTPHYHPWICGQTPPESLHYWPDGGRNWLVDHKREDRTPPLARVIGVGRQRQQPLRKKDYKPTIININQ